MDEIDSRIWRIRMAPGQPGTDYSEQAWGRGEIGIWYGKWSHDELPKARAGRDPAT